ncbi:tyrosine-type recombinase/integrase [Microbacterium kribbense]|uniref:Tyrosine-type recombinase/integrase n=1 Tax=Microbacterium kribbense TaxID=433645 RepID=A0ABP7GCY3_9MICO
MEKPRHLPSGKWQGRVTGADGKRHSAGVHTSKRKAQIAQARKLAELADAARDAETPTTKTPFIRYAEKYLFSRRPSEVGGLAPSSYYKYQRRLQGKLIPVFGHLAIEEITTRQIREWWADQSSAPSERKSAYYLLHSILEVALDDELINRNPCRVRGSGKKASKTRPTFTEEHIAQLYAATEDLQTRALVALLAGTGLRIGEAVALDWDHISFFDQRADVVRHLTCGILLEGTKGGKEETRSPSLPRWVTDELAGLLRGTDGVGAIFRNMRGTRLSVDGAERIFRKLRASAGLEAMHLHDIRHVSLTAYARQPGVTLADVMARGGHKSVIVAATYQHSDDSRDQAITATLPNPLLRKV